MSFMLVVVLRTSSCQLHMGDMDLSSNPAPLPIKRRSFNDFFNWMENKICKIIYRLLITQTINFLNIFLNRTEFFHAFRVVSRPPVMQGQYSVKINTASMDNYKLQMLKTEVNNNCQQQQ